MIWNKEETKERLDKQKDWMFEIKKKQVRNNRTYAQVKYYFWVIIKYIAEEIWLSNQFEIMELHSQIKDYFWLETTTWLDIPEFSAMCEEIRAWYLEHRNLYIPLPREDEDLKSLEKYLF